MWVGADAWVGAEPEIGIWGVKIVIWKLEISQCLQLVIGFTRLGKVFGNLSIWVQFAHFGLPFAARCDALPQEPAYLGHHASQQFGL